MAFNFSDRHKRGEKILPYILKKVWQDREDKSEESQIKQMAILRDFIEEDMQVMSSDGDHHAYEGYLHPSSLGGCARQQWFKLIGAESSGAELPEQYCRKMRIFSNGDMLHLRWAAVLKYYGILLTREVTVHDAVRKIVGKMDAKVAVPDEGEFIVDFKSANPIFFDKMVSSGNPGDGYVAQINLYMYYAQVQRGAILVENKANQDVIEFPMQYDQALVETLHQRASDILAAVETRKAPEKEFEAMNKPPCSWCDYRDVCCAPTRVKKLEGGENVKSPEKATGNAGISIANRKVLLERLYSKQ